jgi:hypothetical protein
MAIHSNLTSLLGDSLKEYLDVAEACIKSIKPIADGVSVCAPAASGWSERVGSRDWSNHQEPPCFGYPAALLLFSIVDTIGSYHHDLPGYGVEVDSKRQPIPKRPLWNYFYILNSDFYKQKLTGNEIKTLYFKYRCLLTHNAALAQDRFLENLPSNPDPFPLDGCIRRVNIAAFLNVSKKAVSKFKSKLDLILKDSPCARDIRNGSS